MLPPTSDIVSSADLFGSAVVCLGYRDALAAQTGPPRYWLETLAVVTVLQFGGTTLTGLALGQTPSWLSSHTASNSLLFAWWATFFCPLDAWYRFLSLKGVRFCVTLGAWFATAHAVTSWGMDKALAADHLRAQGSLLVALLAATMSSCGGGLIASAFNLTEPTWRFQKASLFCGPHFGIEKGFICAVCYYLLRNPHGFLWNAAVLEPMDARAVTSLLMVELSLAKYFFPSWRITEVRGSYVNKQKVNKIPYPLFLLRIQVLGAIFAFTLRIQPYIDVSKKVNKPKAA